MSQSVGTKICVVGAGISGVTASRALSYLGYSVELLESRKKLTGSVAYAHKNVIMDNSSIELIYQLDSPLYQALQASCSPFVHRGVRTHKGEMQQDILPPGADAHFRPSYMTSYDRFVEASLFTALPDSEDTSDALSRPCLPLHLGRHVVGMQHASHDAKPSRSSVSARPTPPLTVLWAPEGARAADCEAECDILVAADGPCGAAAAIARGRDQSGSPVYPVSASNAGIEVHGALPVPQTDILSTPASLGRGRVPLSSCPALGLDNAQCFTTARDGVALTAVVDQHAVRWRMTVAPGRVPSEWVAVAPLVGLGQALSETPAAAMAPPPSLTLARLATGVRPGRPTEGGAATAPSLGLLVSLLDGFPEHLRALVGDTPADAVSVMPTLEHAFSKKTDDKLVAAIGSASYSVLPHALMSDSAAIEDALTLALTINRRVNSSKPSAPDTIEACLQEYRNIRAVRAEKLFTASKSLDTTADSPFWSAISRFARRYEQMASSPELIKEYRDLHHASVVPTDLLTGLKLNK